MPDYEWDEEKRKTNIEKHGFDFIDVWMIVEGDHVFSQAKPGKSGEIRFRATGFIYGEPATAIYTMRGEVVRVISVRKARRNERDEYQALLE